MSFSNKNLTIKILINLLIISGLLSASSCNIFQTGPFVEPTLTTPEPDGGLAQTGQTSQPINSQPGSTTLPPVTNTPELSPTVPTIPTDTPIPVPTDTPTSTPTETSLPVPPGIPMPYMGVTSERYTPEIFDGIQAAGFNLARIGNYNWSSAEPVEGARDWAAQSDVEERIKLATSRGIMVDLIVRSTPEWAQLVPDKLCGAIKADKFQSFAFFMHDLVDRLSQPPYNVKYWELGNEPDVDPAILGSDSPFGCQGDPNDPYYGGGYYAEMLKVVYPEIKAADPEAKVLIGGLLLDCDPTHPAKNKPCASGLFFKGILENGGGHYFDIVSYHGYPYYWGSLWLDEHYPTWEERGGVVLGKANYLRELLNEYGLDKPIFATESSLLCNVRDKTNCQPPKQDFYDAQADYIVWLYVRNWANGINATVWYQYDGPGWQYDSLREGDGSPKPALLAFQFLIKELAGANYIDVVSQYPELRGYEFAAPGKRIWVLWSPDTAPEDQPHRITLPEGVVRIYDEFGNEIPLNGAEIDVKRPIYVEMDPAR